MKLFPLVGVILILSGLISCNNADTDKAVSETPPIDSVFNAYHEFKQRINPIESTKAGESKYNHQVANYISDSYFEDLRNNYSAFIDILNQYDSTMVDPSEWLSMKVMRWDCEVKLEGLNNKIATVASPIYNLPSFELMPLIQIQSLHLYFSQLAGGTSVHPFKTEKNYTDWLLRVNDYLLFLDTCIEKMRIGMESGIVLPKALTKKMIPQIKSFITDSLDEHLFYTPIRNLPATFSEDQRLELSTAYAQMIRDHLIPKYTELNDFLEQEYLPVCRETSGIGSLPDGPETYKYLIKLNTTTTMTVDEIHQLGESEVERILAEMEKAKNEMGFKGNIKDFLKSIRNSPEQMPFSDPNEVIDNFNSIKLRVEENLGQIFDLKPKADFEVRRTESFREASASAEYVPGSKDATRPGTFYVPIPDVTAYNKYSDEALFLHEAIPGHHYQLSLQQENNNLPEFLHPESMGVFVEGWALYAESLGSELGLYNDPVQYFGKLSMEMHRAIRLVVDTGIHGKGWTREQAIQYSLDHEAESEASIISEIERYMATPGQALSYKIGELKIRELRTRAEKALGEKFSIKEYHNQVLNSGSLPLVLLEQKIDKWIKSQLD